MTCDPGKIYFVLPAYDPDEKMLPLVHELSARKRSDDGILIVDDGSTPARREKIFSKLEHEPGVTILHHDVNRGKGAALKTAFRFVLERSDATIGCVTADCDGQHPVERILQAAQLLRENPDHLVLGCRCFSGDQPWKSRVGNCFTKWIFRVLLRRELSDTQTGLRGVPRLLMADCLKIRQDRFEFETRMLLIAPEGKIVEFPLEMIYFNQNSGTHFRPVKDALRIYGVIFRFFFSRLWLFLLSSLSAYFIDLGVFSLLYYGLLSAPVKLQLPLAGSCDIRLFLCCITARIVSSIWNFLMNRVVVFNHKKTTHWWSDAARYYLLAGGIMFLSWGGLQCITFLTRGRFTLIAKILIDAVLFLISYTVQRNHVFNRSK